MEGLTETGAPNPFICVRPRKREEWGRGGMGLQNATALSPLQTRPPQPSEHETHLMWSMHSSGRIHTHAHTVTHLSIYGILKCLLKHTHAIDTLPRVCMNVFTCGCTQSQTCTVTVVSVAAHSRAWVRL